MSSDSDKFVFQQALEEQDNSVLFQAKRWVQVTDNSSGGSFTSQIQFDLNTIASQSNYVDLKQAYIMFPVKLSIFSKTAKALSNLDATSACIKNSFLNFLNSAQLTIGGTTLFTSQQRVNINAHYKALSKWSQDELNKFGPTIGYAIDEYTDSLDNLAFTGTSGLTNPYAGVMYDTTKLAGYTERVKNLNNATTSTSSLNKILTTPTQSHKSSIQWDASTTTINTDRWVGFYLGVIRLGDIFDLDNFVPMKNMKGYLYLNTNSATSDYTATAVTGLPTAKPQNTAIYGSSQPAMVNYKKVNDGTDPVNVVFKSEISAIKSSTLTDATPPIQNAILTVPFYIGSPEVDRALGGKKTFRYRERYNTTVLIPKNGQQNLTLTPGIANARKLIMLPILQGSNSSSSTDVTCFADQPELSPFDIAGCGGSSPFAFPRSLQVQHAGQPVFTQPIDSMYDLWLNEGVQTGLDGSQNVESASGLLNQKKFNNHGYIAVDLSRRVNGDDGASKSVQLIVTNPCNADMRLICDIEYDREIMVDPSMGTVVQGV